MTFHSKKWDKKKESLSHKLSKSREVSNPITIFGNKKFVIGLTLIILIAFGVVMYEPAFHSYIAGTPIGSLIHDPDTVIWQSQGGSNLPEYNIQNFQFRDNFIGSTDTMETTLTSNTVSYSGTVNSDGIAMIGSGYRNGECVYDTGVTGTLTSISFSLKKVGSPTGIVSGAVAIITGGVSACQSTDFGISSAVGSTNGIDMTSLTTSYVTYTFTFGTYSISSSVAYGIWIVTSSCGCDSLNRVHVGMHNTNEYSNGNMIEYVSQFNGEIGFDAPFTMIIESGTGQTSVALTKAQVGDLSIATKKALSLNYTWYMSNPTANLDFGVFLTTNGTLPTQSNWNPYNDTSVSYLLRIRCASSCSSATQTWNFKVFSLRTLGQQHSIATEDNSGNPYTGSSTCGVNPGSGSCFLSSNLIVDGNPPSYFLRTRTLLNYTGRTGTGSCNFSGSGISAITIGSGCSSLITWDNTVNGFTSNIVSPIFQMQTQQYYLGVYMLATSTTAQLEVAFQQDIGTLAVSTYNTATEIVNPPNIDTGGFFGPVIKALINIGVWAIQQILISFTFIGSVIVMALNALGGLFGLGQIGTQLSNFFSGIYSWLANVFGPIIAIIGSLANQAIDDVNIIVSFFTQSIWLTWISNTLINVGNSLSLVVTVFNQFVSMFGTTLQATNYFFIMFYLYGMYEVYMNGTRGFIHWLKIGEVVLTSFFKAGYWFAKESWTILLNVKQFIVQWL